MTGRSIREFPPIDGSDTSSFAAFTIKERFPIIIERIIEDNEYPDSFVNRLLELKQEVLSNDICQLIETGNDIDKWNEWIKPQLGKNWFDAPFYFVEAYFYRLILDAVDYHTLGLDPFAPQKKKDVSTNIPVFSSILTDYDAFFNAKLQQHHILKKLLYTSLWGNKADLSQLNKNGDKHAPTDAMIIDDLEVVVQLFKSPLDRIDIILDNSGVELFTDLVVVEKLVTLGLVNHVVLHAKAYPTFVSDATLEDIDYLLNVLMYNVNSLATELYHNIKSLKQIGSIVFNAHDFWNSPLHFNELPFELENELEKSDLVIFKGDANYRRVFGDKVIPHELDVTHLSNYLPSRSLAIRILKSEILVGMKNVNMEEIRQKDKDCLVNGKYGIIQLLN